MQIVEAASWNRLQRAQAAASAPREGSGTGSAATLILGPVCSLPRGKTGAGPSILPCPGLLRPRGAQEGWQNCTRPHSSVLGAWCRWHGSSRPAGCTGGSGTGPKEGVPRGQTAPNWARGRSPRARPRAPTRGPGPVPAAGWGPAAPISGALHGRCPAGSGPGEDGNTLTRSPRSPRSPRSHLRDVPHTPVPRGRLCWERGGQGCPAALPVPSPPPPGWVPTPFPSTSLSPSPFLSP